MFLSRYKKSILVLFLFLTWLFTVWQLDLIRDLFIRTAINFTRENPGLSGSEIFIKVLWDSQFGFPPFCWFGLFVSLQVAFDLLYGLQAIVIFLLVALIYKEYFKKVLLYLRKKF